MQQLEYMCAQHHDNICIKCIAEILSMYIRYEMTRSSYRYTTPLSPGVEDSDTRAAYMLERRVRELKI